MGKFKVEEIPMRFKLAAIILVLVVPGFAVPALGDYDQMQEALHNYTAPEFFVRFAGEDTGSDADLEYRVDEAFERAVDQVKSMKAEQEKASENRSFLFVNSTDSSLVASMMETAKDNDAIAARLKKGVRLEEIRILAALRNPAVQAAQRQVIAAMASYDQVTGLDETIYAYQGLTRGVNPGAGPVSMKGSIRGAWPLPARTALKGRIVTQDVEMAKTRQAIVEKNTVTLAAGAYWDLALVDASLTITRETMEAFARLKDVATSLHNSGKTGFQDIVRINIRLALLKENLVTLASKRKTVSVRLAEVLDLASDTPMGRTIPVAGVKKATDTESLYATAIKHRQELTLIRQKIDKLSHMVELGESMTNAPFTLGFSFNENDLVSSQGSFEQKRQKSNFPEKTMAGMKNNQPSNAFNSVSQPWLAQTRQRLESLKLDLVAQENAAVRMVREAWFTLDKNRREMVLYKRDILPLSKSALDVSTREYEAGAIGFADAILAYTDWLDTRLDLAEKRSGFGKALAVLEQMTGTQL